MPRSGTTAWQYRSGSIAAGTGAGFLLRKRTDARLPASVWTLRANGLRGVTVVVQEGLHREYSTIFP
jgi:hypothetical protein